MLRAVDSLKYLEALLNAERAGTERILSFYDHRAGMICLDPRLLLIPLDDHICHRGDGLFESICYRDNKIFALDAHLKRMEDGASALDITIPVSTEQLKDIICSVAAAGGKNHGDLRVFLSRGPGGFGISPTECPKAGLYVVALASKLPSAEIYDKGLTAFSSAIPPKQEYLAKIKNTNYLPNVLMSVEARKKQMDVAITFEENGYMGEAAIANIAIIDENDCLRSPEIRRILPGTTLLAALEIARAHMQVKEGPIHRDELFKAKEMLLFTSSTLCIAITHFDGQPIGYGTQSGKPGVVALWMKDALYQYMIEHGTGF